MKHYLTKIEKDYVNDFKKQTIEQIKIKSIHLKEMNLLMLY